MQNEKIVRLVFYYAFLVEVLPPDSSWWIIKVCHVPSIKQCAKDVIRVKTKTEENRERNNICLSLLLLLVLSRIAKFNQWDGELLLVTEARSLVILWWPVVGIVGDITRLNYWKRI